MGGFLFQSFIGSLVGNLLQRGNSRQQRGDQADGKSAGRCKALPMPSPHATHVWGARGRGSDDHHRKSQARRTLTRSNNTITKTMDPMNCNSIKTCHTREPAHRGIPDQPATHKTTGPEPKRVATVIKAIVNSTDISAKGGQIQVVLLSAAPAEPVSSSVCGGGLSRSMPPTIHLESGQGLLVTLEARWGRCGPPSRLSLGGVPKWGSNPVQRPHSATAARRASAGLAASGFPRVRFYRQRTGS